MNQEYNLTLTMTLILFMLGCAIYMHKLKNSFSLSDGRYEQVGVMEYHDNGNTVYIPVFAKRTNK